MDATGKRQATTLYGSGIVLRPLATRDAPSLATLTADEAVIRFVHEPPSTELEWGRFIGWCQMQEEADILRCWAIEAGGSREPVGVVQLRRLDPQWHAAEWGILLGSALWGSGTCLATAHCVLDFAFTSIGVHRVEARVVDANVRARRMMEKLGAVREATLRDAFRRASTSYNQDMWSILAHEWRANVANAPAEYVLPRDPAADALQFVTSPDA